MDEEAAPKLKAGDNAGELLNALSKAYNEPDQETWRSTCETIERAYYNNGGRAWYGGAGLLGEVPLNQGDNGLDLFWSSYQVLKPAVYAKPPRPAVAAIFKDSDRVKEVAAELLERVSTVALMQEDMDLKMQHTRDDVLFFGRGVLWCSYISKDGQKACVEFVDREDFRHENARTWEAVGWAAKRSWLSKEDAAARFGAEKADRLKYKVHRDDYMTSDNNESYERKAGIWELWHKAHNKVYWVSDGCQDILDVSDPMFEVDGFFPCPRPAYSDTRLRTLTPIPDWTRYADHYHQINVLTNRIYTLLDMVKLKGFVPSGGDAAEAMKAALAMNDNVSIVGVPGAQLVAGQNDLITWLPLEMIAQTIQGCIEARNHLIDDYYQLSGISDIMRGATEAQETLGAQQLKSQYGSVRVQEKVQELQRIAADVVRIVAQIAAQKFTAKTLLDMSQMDIRTQAQIDKRIREIEDAAAEELKAVGAQVKEEAQAAVAKMQEAVATGRLPEEEAQQQVEQLKAQLDQQIQQAAQENNAKFGPQLEEAQQAVPMEAVLDLLRNDRTRSFTFEIESDSTILTDELQEKASRNEFLQTFVGASQALMQIGMMGEEGADLAGAFLKFAVAPYRAGRSMDGAIDKLVDALPRLAMQAAEQGQDGGLAEAQKALADAEMQKARAAQTKVEADAARDAAEMQRKMAEMQQKAFEAEQKSTLEQGKLELQLADLQGKLDKQTAEMDKIRAETLQILNNIQLANQQQVMDEFKSVATIQMEERGQAFNEERAATEDQFRERGEFRADRQQDLSERGAQQGMHDA